MTKLLKLIMDDPAIAVFYLCFLLTAFMFIGTLVSATYINIHEAVNQCHIQEKS